MILFYMFLGLQLIPWLLGILVLVHLFKRPEPPLDQSNVFNRLRVFWFALTRQAQMVERFPWLRNDEWENFHK